MLDELSRQFFCMVRTANQWTRMHHLVAHLPCFSAQFIEFFRRYVALHWQLLSARSQVLTHGQEVHIDSAHIPEHFKNFFSCLTETEHYSGFCWNVRAQFLRHFKNLQRAIV